MSLCYYVFKIWPYVTMPLKYALCYYVFKIWPYVTMSLKYVFMSYATNSKKNDTFDKTTLRQNE